MEKYIKEIVRNYLRKQGLSGECEVELVSKAEMGRLSKKYGRMLGDTKYKLHEVISFPFEPDKGESAWNPDGVKRWGTVAVIEGKSESETEFLVLHGVDHLLGRHHN